MLLHLENLETFDPKQYDCRRKSTANLALVDPCKKFKEGMDKAFESIFRAGPTQPVI